MRTTGHIIARDWLSGEVGRWDWERGWLKKFQPLAVVHDSGWWIAPGLLELQVNGFAGVDFQQDGLGESDLQRAVLGLQRAGCPRFLPTLISDAWPRMMTRLRRLKQLRDGVPDWREAIAGWHIEGPFLSAQPGFHGAHDPRWQIDPRPEQIRELRQVAGADPVLLTLAPERAGAGEAIALARALGITVSLGHTDADADTLARAVAAGASGFTHLGNACPQALDRHDNILWRVLETPGLRVSLIPDGRHVSPALFRILHRLLPSDALVYTTDAMAAAAAAPGRYRLGALALDVGADGVVRQPGRTNFAGSALTPIRGVFLAAAMLRCRWQEAWARASLTPAEWLGLGGGLQPGAAATFCLVKTTTSGEAVELRVFVAGEEIADAGQHDFRRE